MADAGLMAEIDAAVESASKEIASGKAMPDAPDVSAKVEVEETADADESSDAAPAGQDEPEEKGDDKAATGRDEKGRFVPKPETGLTSASLERAVKAGLTLDEAKQFPNDALLAATCARIEGVGKGTGKDPGSQNGAGASGEAKPAAGDMLSKIPDLSPELYDEKIVAGFEAMKAIIRELNGTIEGLRGGQAKDWLTTQLEGVKSFTKGDASKEAALGEKFAVLQAGYKAAGKTVTDEAAFQEATKLVLGGDMEAAEKERKGEAAKRRSGQLLQRPGGRRVEAKPDAVTEVADMIDRKYFKK